MTDLSSRPFELPESGSSADKLLDKTVEYILDTGTSHRMLQSRPTSP